MPRAKQTAELAAEPRPPAKDPLLPGEADDVVHRQEVTLICLVGDQLQLLFDLGT
jgi:hypothetical protein